MKDILNIVFRLTVSCLLAATVMGVCFIFTSNAKKHNEHVKEQKVMYELLGYKGDVKVPESVAMHDIYRYIMTSGSTQSVSYLLPQKEGEGFLLVELDLEGNLVKTYPVTISEADVLEPEPRKKAIETAVGPVAQIVYADTTRVVTDGGQRIAYLLGGKFQGFKTYIHVMLGVDPDFTMLGLEILEHEEDPGLGAEIEQDYFKNQFKAKPFESLKNVDVVKEPIPADYLKALNGQLDEADILKFREQYKDHDIYALTGATISTKAVSDGVRAIVSKFAYRVNVLDKVLTEQQIAVPF